MAFRPGGKTMRKLTTKITTIALSAMLLFATVAPVNVQAEETTTTPAVAEQTEQTEPSGQAEQPAQSEEQETQKPVPSSTTAKKAVTRKVVKTYTGKVAHKKLVVRKTKSKHSKKLKTYKRGAKITLLSIGSKWVKVKVGSKVGYAWGPWISYHYGTAYKPTANVVTGKITKKRIAIRASKSSHARALRVLTKGTKLKVLTPGHKWVKVQFGNVIGYMKGKYIKVGHGAGSVKASSSYAVYAGDTSGGTGAAVARLGLRYVGGRYVWGGSTLGRGVDCSGFVMALYRRFGKHLPHSSSAMRHVGRSVGGLKHAKPGDIVCYSGHVGIYIGGGKIVHASNPRNGIKISNARYRSPITVRRIF